MSTLHLYDDNNKEVDGTQDVSAFAPYTWGTHTNPSDGVIKTIRVIIRLQSGQETLASSVRKGCIKARLKDYGCLLKQGKCRECIY